MKEKIVLLLAFGMLLFSIAPILTTFAQSPGPTFNQDTVLPFDSTTVYTTSSTTSTVLSFSSSTVISSSSTTTITGNSIIFNIFETNDGIIPLTNPFITSNSPLCNPVFVDGDVNNDGILDPGEQWHYACDVVSVITGMFEIILTGFGTAPDDTVITWPGDPDERIIGTVVVINDPSDQIQSIIDEVHELDEDEISPRNARTPLKYLDAALTKLNSEDEAGAIAMLERFNSVMQIYIDRNRISEPVGTSLIGSANNIIESLS